MESLIDSLEDRINRIDESSNGMATNFNQDVESCKRVVNQYARESTNMLNGIKDMLQETVNSTKAMDAICKETLELESDDEASDTEEGLVRKWKRKTRRQERRPRNADPDYSGSEF